MKTIKFIPLFLLLFFLNSCSEESNLTYSMDSFNVQEYSNDREVYDKNVKKIAKGISKLLSSKKNRIIIKQQIQKRVDGDYDFLFKDTKSINTEDNVNLFDLIVNISISEDDDKDKSKSETYNFLEQFKKLQFSIPVNFENWDEENFIPMVGFLTSDYNEDTEHIEAFDQNGKLQKLSNKETPNVPVIIISLNERSDDNGDIYDNYKKASSASQYNFGAPTNLSATSTTNGILLSWNYNGDPNSEYIIIERSNGTVFNVITSFPNNQFQYLDHNGLSYGNTYYYRIKVFSTMYGYSNYTSTVYLTYQFNLSNPISFNSENSSPNEITLDWKNTMSNITGLNIKIDRWNTGVSSNWVNIATLPLNSNSYIDNNLVASVYPNNKYKYRICYTDQNNNSSSYSYSGIYNSKRNSGDPLIITHISIPHMADFEPWPSGQPDFLFNLVTMDSITDAPIIVKDKLPFRPSSSKLIGGSIYTNALYNVNFNLLSDWTRNFFKSIMTVNLIEEDDHTFSSHSNFNIAIKKAFKTPIGDIDFSFTDSIQINIESTDDNLNTEYIQYWEEPVNIKTFGFDVKLRFNKENTSGIVNMN